MAQVYLNENLIRGSKEKKKLAKSYQEKMKERMQPDLYMTTDSIATKPVWRSESLKDGDYVGMDAVVSGHRKSHSFSTMPPENQYEAIGRPKVTNYERYERMYEVAISPNSKSREVKLEGSYKLRVAIDSIDLLKRQKNKQTLLISWPIITIRNYGHQGEIFKFEAGRRSPTGEGKFNFITVFAEEIYKEMEERIKTLLQHKITPVCCNQVYAGHS